MCALAQKNIPEAGKILPTISLFYGINPAKQQPFRYVFEDVFRWRGEWKNET
jgi:hypothetical protein